MVTSVKKGFDDTHFVPVWTDAVVVNEISVVSCFYVHRGAIAIVVVSSDEYIKKWELLFIFHFEGKIQNGILLKCFLNIVKGVERINYEENVIDIPHV